MPTESFTSSSTGIATPQATLTDGKLHSFVSESTAVATPTAWFHELNVLGEITTIPYFDAPPPS